MILSRAVYAILGLLLAFVLYMVYLQGVESWRWGIVPIVFLAVMNYVFQPQIDYWWFEKTKPTLDPVEHRFLMTHLPFYRALSPQEQENFGRECIRFNHNVEYILKGVPSFPDDLKTIIAAYAISLRYAFDIQESNPFEKMERIVFYPHPFMSPEIEEVHACETHFEDGVWVFSLEQFIPGVTKPAKFFNVALYEMSRVLLKEVAEIRHHLEEISGEKLEEYRKLFSNISYDRIQSWINLEELDSKAMYITTLMVHWEEVSSMDASERSEIPLGNDLHHLDVVQAMYH